MSAALDQVLSLSPGERAAHLARLEADDTALAAEVRALLRERSANPFGLERTPGLGPDRTPPPASADRTTETRIGETWDRFAADWRAGRRPRLEEFLARPRGGDPLLFAELFRLEVFYRRKNAETPRLSDYRARFPEWVALMEQELSQETAPDGGGITSDYRGPHRGDLGLSVGALLGGRYRIERLLGRGGMGQVYLAFDETLHRRVAVKLIRPADPSLRERTVGEELFRKAFIQEARVGAQLAHPGIATVFDFGFEVGEPFIVFEHVDGETLSDTPGPPRAPPA